MNMAIIITMNIYISKANEEWLRLQRTSMSGIINKFLDEARAGKHGPHVLASYPTMADTLKSDKVRPPVPKPRIDATKGTATPSIPQPTPVKKTKIITYKPTNNWGA